MAIYHCATKPLARSSGRSAVAAAAYRSGDCLVDERQGIEHDYTRRSGVEYTELVLPEGAGEWTRATLWNAAEMAEKRKDARTAREWEIALPAELSAAQRQELAVRFAHGLATKYGCAVDVAVHAPDREGDQRNWHAHLLATTRKVTPDSISEKCDIELADSKRLSLGLAPARMEIETVRQMWAQEVNRQLEQARRPERVDHRSLAAQREEAIQRGQAEKVVELDRAPQVKLGWKVVQMERRGDPSDRGNQLRQVQAENLQRQAQVLDIGRLREQLAERQRQEAVRQKEAERQKAVALVEVLFYGKSREQQKTLLRQWQALATQDIPRVDNARAIWEKDNWDQDAKAWRETRRTIDWESQEVHKNVQAIEGWYRAHPLQTLALRTGLMRTPAELGRLEEQYSQNARFLQGSRQKLEQLEQAWERKQPAYEQQLERRAGLITEARENLRVIAENPEHFRKLWEQVDQAVQREGTTTARTGAAAQSRPRSWWGLGPGPMILPGNEFHSYISPDSMPTLCLISSNIVWSCASFVSTSLFCSGGNSDRKWWIVHIPLSTAPISLSTTSRLPVENSNSAISKAVKQVSSSTFKN